MNSKILCFGLMIVLSLLTRSLIAQPVTHMGIGPDDHVTLGACTSLSCVLGGKADLSRTFPDGTFEEGPFVIPERHVLVVTDVDWSFRGTVPALLATLLANHRMKVTLIRSNDSIQATNEALISTAIIRSTNECGDPLGCNEKVSAAANTQMTTGFVVTAGAHLTSALDAENLDLIDPINQEFNLRVRGYLVPVD